MSKDKITPINRIQSIPKPGSETLSSLRQALDHWRETKTKQNEKIPPHLWDKIFALLNTEPETKVLTGLSLTKVQLERERQARLEANGIDPTSLCNESMAFCEARPKPEIPLVSKPAKAFSTTTSVVELYRPDGMLMKIHLCTDRFEELLRAFFKG
jgi:hypothetical protein